MLLSHNANLFCKIWTKLFDLTKFSSISPPILTGQNFPYPPPPHFGWLGRFSALRFLDIRCFFILDFFRYPDHLSGACVTYILIPSEARSKADRTEEIMLEKKKWMYSLNKSLPKTKIGQTQLLRFFFWTTTTFERADKFFWKMTLKLFMIQLVPLQSFHEIIVCSTFLRIFEVGVEFFLKILFSCPFFVKLGKKDTPKTVVSVFISVSTSKSRDFLTIG